jgi:hypothetical protein
MVMRNIVRKLLQEQLDKKERLLKLFLSKYQDYPFQMESVKGRVHLRTDDGNLVMDVYITNMDELLADHDLGYANKDDEWSITQKGARWETSGDPTEVVKKYVDFSSPDYKERIKVYLMKTYFQAFRHDFMWWASDEINHLLRLHGLPKAVEGNLYVEGDPKPISKYL